MNLARTGSMKLRNSLRRHGSIHKRDEHNVSQLPVSSSENLIAIVSPHSVATLKGVPSQMITVQVTVHSGGH